MRARSPCRERLRSVARLACSLWLTAAVVGAPQETAPVVLGLQRPEPLDQASVGELLISELGCVACHASECGERQARKIAPDLTQVGGRVAPEYLRSFIADPGGAHPGTTMPNLLDEQEPARRA